MVTSDKSKNSEQSEQKKEVTNCKSMQLPSTTASSSHQQPPTSSSQAVVTSSTSSPSSTSGPASNGGSAPYMRQFRPRSNRNNGTTSLPASAVSAAPYIPPIYQQQGGNPDYMHHHQHVTYAYEAPPPPMGQPPPGWVPAGPYIYAGAGENPAPFVQHMCTMPPPQVVVSSSASSSRPTSSSRSTTAVSSSVSSTVSSNSTVVSSSEVHQPQEYEVEYHLHQGEVIQLQLGDGRVQIIQGPANIRMVSPNSSPPLALPMQVPQGHMVQQILDPSGTLQHVILSHDPMLSQQTHPPPPQQSHHGGVPITPYSTGIAGGSAVAPIVVTAAGTHFATPTAVCSGAPPRQPFPSAQYGPPPHGAAIIPAAVTPTPPSHGPSPTPSSGSGGGFQQQGYRSKHGRLRGNARQPLTTPPTSPAKNRGKESTSFRSPSSGSGSSGIGSSSSSTSGGPSSSSGSNSVNVLPGGSRVKTPRSHQDDSEESGVGHEDDEEMHQLLVELLSLIRTPKVTEIQGRQALLKWGPPSRGGEAGAKFEPLEHISDSEFRYEVCLSDKGKDGKYRTILQTTSIECRLTDLRPCTDYHIRIHAMTESLRGGASDTVSFTTKSCEPDKPAPPKLISRTKTSISLKWNAPPSDNGKHILHYILECDNGRGQTTYSWCPTCYMETPCPCPCKVYGAFEEIFRGRAKNFNVTKLANSTAYRFRLIAENELGRSRPSEVVAFQTQGTAPPKPQPPGLHEATKSSLHLVWPKRPTDSEFILQMDDQISGYGFLAVHNGSDTSFTSQGLRRNMSYKFRLQAQNEEGVSPWSDEVSFLTLPDVPGPPLRPATKGRLHPHSFKVRWDPPADDGGSPVENYILEIDGGQGWQTVYKGNGLEHLCDYLYPGTQYKVRVSCTSKGGVSDYSEECHICTEPVAPGQCAPPRPHGKPKANSLHLKWGWPELDGGSPVTEFEIDMTSPDNKTKAVYRGRETECVVASLLPGRPYLFQVRAFNRVGHGPWSDSLEVVSGAGAPDTPLAPRIQCRSGCLATIDWNEPSFNGAAVTEYRLQLAIVSSRKYLSPPPGTLASVASTSSSSSTSSSVADEDDLDDDLEDFDEEDDDENQESLDSDLEEVSKKRVVKRKRKSFRNDDEDELSDSDEEDFPRRSIAQLKSKPTKEELKEAEEPLDEVIDDELPKELLFTNIYTGPNRTFEARSLEPATTYQFRVCAVNSAGASDWSELTETSTPPAPPASVSGVHLKDSSATSLTLSWTRPQSNGEHILHYNVDTGSSVISTHGPDTSFHVESLKPDTVYAIRVQAVNSVGCGAFSNIARLSTQPLPPAPPRCECVNANYNSLKLKWGDSKSGTLTSDPCQYTLEMENSRNQFQVVYTGNSVSHKISKLVENKVYRFRMCASNSAGNGPYSQVYEFRTAYAHPHPIKAAPKVNNITEDGCLVEWSPLKQFQGQGDLQYRVSLTKVKDNESKAIYFGSDTQFRASSLEARTEYTIRVCGVRIPVSGTELPGPFSPPAIFSTLSNDGNGASTSNATAVSKKMASSSSGFVTKRDNEWSDKQWALVIVLGLSAFAVFIAFIMQQII